MIGPRDEAVEVDQRAATYTSVEVGDQLPELSIGPISEMDVMRWCTAVENFHRIHYDERFAVKHEGLSGVIVNGPFKMAMLVRAVTGWAHQDARIRAISCRHRAPTYVGEVLVAGGEVTAKRRDHHGSDLIEIALHLTNADGIDVCPGTTTLSFSNDTKGQS